MRGAGPCSAVLPEHSRWKQDVHWLDGLAGLVIRTHRLYPPLFPGGWGEAPRLAACRERVQESPPVAIVDVLWHETRSVDGLLVRDGHFESPVSELPAGSGRASVRLLLPGADSRRLCLLMAASNDHGYATRTRLARELAVRGIGSVLLENPYYGTRRPAAAADRQPVQTVLDLLLMGLGAVEEGRALLGWLREHHETASLGVSGYSMGGNIASLVGATVPFPVAVAPLAASHSPGPVFTQGLLAGAVHWPALGPIAEARPRLANALGAASTLHFPPPPHAATAVLLAARADGYVPRDAVEALHRHWPGSELRWVGGGHVSLHRRRSLQAETIEEAFQRATET